MEIFFFWHKKLLEWLFVAIYCLPQRYIQFIYQFDQYKAKPLWIPYSILKVLRNEIHRNYIKIVFDQKQKSRRWFRSERVNERTKKTKTNLSKDCVHVVREEHILPWRFHCLPSQEMQYNFHPYRRLLQITWLWFYSADLQTDI